ncbi:MAG: hypothetical protein HQ503_04630 [Rhodospirillales bacterium]|nr:hypothetical protein [Rhodospirillales bacterium]
MNLQLSFAMSPNPRNRAIFDGRVSPDGIDFVCTPIAASELFWRQLRFGDFDVSEMSVSSLLIALANGDTRYIGLPVFTTHRFFHNMILVRRDAGIDKPEDLRGKRIGVPEYQQTAALWGRGVLKHEFGVEQSDIEWWMERTPEHSHGGATGFKPPPGTTINQIPGDKNIGSMMLANELDGTLLHFGGGRTLIDRTTIDLPNHPDVKTLFPDPVAEGVRYYEKTGMFPINHAMIIRRSIVEKNPWAALNIYKAMVRANDIANTERMEHVLYYRQAGLLSADGEKALNEPLIEHGLKANLKEIEAAIQYSAEQSLTPRQLKLEEVFYASTLDE